MTTPSLWFGRKPVRSFLKILVYMKYYDTSYKTNTDLPYKTIDGLFLCLPYEYSVVREFKHT